MAKSETDDPRPWQVWNITDGHFGSEFAPDPHGSKAQKWAAARWQQMVETMAEQAKTFRIRVGFGGEFTEKGLLSVSLAVEMCRPLMEIGSAFHTVRGTAWHTEDGKADTEVAKILGIKDLSEEWRGVVDGRLIWHTHHGPKPSVSRRGRTNALYNTAADIYVDCLEGRERIPDLWMYGHWHSPASASFSYFDVNGTEHDLKVACFPPWQLKTRYGFKAVPFTPIPWIGAAAYIPSAHKIVHHMTRVPFKYNRGETQ